MITTNVVGTRGMYTPRPEESGHSPRGEIKMIWHERDPDGPGQAAHAIHIESCR
ncbi:MAG: hypothetical protein RI573_03660 [Balneolaceae bacterium]|nr:hypothetical protein [Balneolaceae bacterium]